MVTDKRIEELRARLNRDTAVQKSQEEELENLRDKLAEARQLTQDAEEAREILTAVGIATQSNLQAKIAHLVTLALASVFPDPYEFVVNFVHRRNNTEVDLLFRKKGEDMEPMASSGGGAIDIASFALRIAFWSLNKTRPVMILDEPFRNLSADLQPKASALLKTLSKELGLQFIVVSHQEGINEEADRQFLIKNGELAEVIG